MWHNIIDYLFVFILIFILYRFIRKTEALKIVVGIFIIYTLAYIANHLGFDKTYYILNLGTHAFAYATVLLFLPELRMALKKISGYNVGPKKPTNATLKAIEDSLFEMSKKKHGALIIMDEKGNVSAASENLHLIDARISSSLIGTIFHPNTPLHDGAVLISKGRIKFAGCKLPLSAKKRENFGTLGTRHMVAIETAENFDTIVFVVSEETGSIRIATKQGFENIASRQDFKKFFSEYESLQKINSKPKK